MKKVISNNIKSIITGSLIATSLLGMQSCNETAKADDLGTGDDVREAVDEAKDAVDGAVKDASEVGKDVEGKCGEGKCGEGKCGEEDKTSESKCGEGKCGEGKCGE